MSIIHFMSLSSKRDRATANTQVFRFTLSVLSLRVSGYSTTRLCRDALHAFSDLRRKQATNYGVFEQQEHSGVEILS